MVSYTERQKVLDPKSVIQYGSHPRRLLIYILMFRAGATPVNATFKDYARIERELVNIAQVNNIKRIFIKAKRFDLVRQWTVKSTHWQDVKTMDAFKEMLLNPY